MSALDKSHASRASSAVGAGDARNAASSHRKFLGQKFGQMWEKFRKFGKFG